MPNFMANASDKLNSIRQSDGKIYGLPSINEAYHVLYGNKMWMNSFKLNEMGAKAPTTTQELYDVCKAYLEKYPDGVCIADMNTGAGINCCLLYTSLRLGRVSEGRNGLSFPLRSPPFLP